MRKKHCRLAALLLAVLLCLTALPVSASAAGDAMSLDQVKALMNAEPLYPQKRATWSWTGCWKNWWPLTEGKIPTPP